MNMRKNFILLVMALAFYLGVNAQTYFQATVQNEGNTLVLKVRPTGGDITLRFSAMEFFLRYPNGSPAFTFGTPVVAPAFSGINFTVKGPNTYGAEAGYTNYVFEWIGGATFVPAVPTTYTNGVEYEIFRVPLNGAPAVTSIELVHNSTQTPTYLNLSDNLGNSWSSVDNLGNSRGNAFYGPGFFTQAAAGGGTNDVLPLNNVPVPVKFNNFTAIRRDADGLLTWAVENESALTDRYEIERSLNGTDFTKIANIAPKNNGLSSNTYVLTDYNLAGLRSAGILYYRVKQVDRDGRFIYSDIRSIRLDGRGFAVGIYPNPVKDVATLNIDLIEDADILVSITDAAGKQVKQVQVQGFKGPNVKKIDLMGMASGAYVFKVSTGTEQKTISVVKGK